MKHVFCLLISLVIFCSNHLHAGFIAGTKIATPTKQVLIEDLFKGNLVTGYDLDTGTCPQLTVQATTISTVTQLYTIATDRDAIVATADQLFFDVVTKKFITADAWTTACIFLTKDLQQLPTRKVELNISEPIRCYDLSIDSPHLFFASDAQILVHNAAALIEFIAPLLIEIQEAAPFIANWISTLEEARLRHNSSENEGPGWARVASGPAQCNEQPRVHTKQASIPQQRAQPIAQEKNRIHTASTSEAVAMVASVTTPATQTQSVTEALALPITNSSSISINTAKPHVFSSETQDIINRTNSSQAYLPLMQEQADWNVTGSINGETVFSNQTNSPWHFSVNANTESHPDVSFARFIKQVNRRRFERALFTSYPNFFTPSWFLEYTRANILKQNSVSEIDYFFGNFEYFQHKNYLEALQTLPCYDQKILGLRDFIRKKTPWYNVFSSTEGVILDKMFPQTSSYVFRHNGRLVSLSELIEGLAAEVDARHAEQRRQALAAQEKLVREQEAALKKAILDTKVLQAQTTRQTTLNTQKQLIESRSNLYETYETAVINDRTYQTMAGQNTFSSVFKSAQSEAAYHKEGLLEYSTSYKDYLREYGFNPDARSNHNRTAVTQASNEILHELYSINQHFGHMYDVAHLQKTAITLIKVAEQAQQFAYQPKTAIAIGQLLRAAQGFQRAAEQVGEYYTKSCDAVQQTTESIDHLINEVFKPLKNDASRVAGDAASLPQDLAASIAYPVNTLADIYNNPHADTQWVADQCRRSLADLLQEEQRIIEATAGTGLQVPVLTPLANLVSQSGHIGARVAAQAPPYQPSQTITRGHQREFIRRVSAISRVEGQAQLIDNQPEVIVTGNVVECTSSDRATADVKQLIINQIDLYEQMLFQLIPRSYSIDATTATSLAPVAPTWTTAEMGDDGLVVTTQHRYRLASYDAATQTWDFVLETSIPQSIDRTDPSVNKFIQSSEAKELKQLRELTNTWPQAIRSQFRSNRPMRKDKPAVKRLPRIGISNQAKKLQTHYGNLETTINNRTFSFQAINRMLDDNIAPSHIADIISNGYQSKAHHPDRSLCIDDKNNIVVVFDQAANRVVSIGAVAEMEQLDEWPDKKRTWTCGSSKLDDQPTRTCGSNKLDAPENTKTCGSSDLDKPLIPRGPCMIDGNKEFKPRPCNSSLPQLPSLTGPDQEQGESGAGEQTEPATGEVPIDVTAEEIPVETGEIGNTGQAEESDSTIESAPEVITEAADLVADVEQDTTLEEFLSNAQESPGNKPQAPVKEYTKPGNEIDAHNDFSRFHPSEIKESQTAQGGSIKIGKLPCGRTIITRTKSTKGPPTLEIQERTDKGMRYIKIRYLS